MEIGSNIFGRKEERVDVGELKERIEEKHLLINSIRNEVEKILVGQRKLIDGLLMGLFLKGHILIEGVPGLAKTSAVKALAESVHVEFKRIQFTPDLLPADLIGTEVFRPKTGDFTIKKGPIFIISFWPTRSTALRPKYNPHCSKPCRNAR